MNEEAHNSQSYFSCYTIFYQNTPSSLPPFFRLPRLFLYLLMKTAKKIFGDENIFVFGGKFALRLVAYKAVCLDN